MVRCPDEKIEEEDNIKKMGKGKGSADNDEDSTVDLAIPGKYKIIVTISPGNPCSPDR